MIAFSGPRECSAACSQTAFAAACIITLGAMVSSLASTVLVMSASSERDLARNFVTVCAGVWGAPNATACDGVWRPRVCVDRGSGLEVSADECIVHTARADTFTVLAIVPIAAFAWLACMTLLNSDVCSVAAVLVAEDDGDGQRPASWTEAWGEEKEEHGKEEEEEGLEP